MTNREWIQTFAAGSRDVPMPQQWMSFFTGDCARRLSPPECHYEQMWLFEPGETFDFSAQSRDVLDKMIAFNRATGRCMIAPGRGAALSWGHGGPGEFRCRKIDSGKDFTIVQYETGVKAEIRRNPHFYHIFDYPVHDLGTAEKVFLPDPDDPARYLGIAEEIAYLKERGEYTLCSLNGFFSGIHYFFMDYQDTLASLLIEPELIEAVLKRLVPWNLTAARHLIAAGADGLALCDDLGSACNLLMAPDLYRKFFKPHHRALCELAHAHGVDVHLHSHGAITPLLDDLAECGFDYINPFDPNENFDLDELLPRYADRFIFCGGMPTDFWKLPDAEQDAVIARAVARYRRYGRYLLMDSGGIPEDVTPEQFRRVLQISEQMRHSKTLNQ